MSTTRRRWLILSSTLLAMAVLGTIFFVRHQQQFLPHVVHIPAGLLGLEYAQAQSLSPDDRFISISSQTRKGGEIQSNIEVRELASNRRLAFFSNAHGGGFSGDGRFLILDYDSDQASKKKACVELVEVGNWKVKHHFLPPPSASFFPDVPSAWCLKSGKKLAVQFGNLGLDTQPRIVIWEIDSEHIEKVIKVGALWRFLLGDDGEITRFHYYYEAGLRNAHLVTPDEVNPITIERPIDSSCSIGGPLGVGIQSAKRWHAFLFDGRTGKILKDLRDQSPQAQIVQNCAISNNNKIIAICYEDYVGIWTGSNNHWNLTQKVPFQPDLVESGNTVFLSKDGEILVQNFKDNQICWRRLK